MIERERKYYLDVLRIVSTFAVITLHTVSKEFWHLNADSIPWLVINVICGSLRWCVPVFIMISGALFLDPEKEISSQKLARNITRIFTAFLFWTIIYALTNGNSGNDTIYRMINGHYHMWFLFMIVGLYCIVPFLRKIVSDEKLLNYFLLLSFLFAFLIPMLRKIEMVNTYLGGGS